MLQIHLINPFGKKVQTRAYYHNETTARQAAQLWQKEFPECSVKGEDVTDAGPVEVFTI